MDRLVFAAMTGARSALGQMAVTANNLANASTPGFREQIAAFRAVPMRRWRKYSGVRARHNAWV